MIRSTKPFSDEILLCCRVQKKQCGSVNIPRAEREDGETLANSNISDSALTGAEL